MPLRIIIKLLFYFFLFTSCLNAISLEEANLEVFLLENNNSNKIKNYKTSHKALKDYKIKILINKKTLKDESYYLKISCNVSDISKANTDYEIEFDNIIIKIDKHSKEEINIYFQSKQIKDINIIASPIHSFEYENLYKYRNLISGLSYGIIFCAFLYSLIIYINTGFISLLYYALLQLFLASNLGLNHYFSISSVEFLNKDIISAFLVNLIMLMLMLFSKEVLVFKNYSSFFKYILTFMIGLNLFDLLFICIFQTSIIYEYMPPYVYIFTLIIFGLISAFQGYRFSIFYTCGWLVIFISLIITEYNLSNFNDFIVFNIGLPLESIILSVALGYKLKNIINEQKKKDELLVQQSKLASMGEMINNIAHQWRQPLSNLSFINMDLKMAIKTDDINNKYLSNIIADSSSQIDFMSKTLDNFKGFYQPHRNKESFYLSHAVKKAIDIINPTLKEEKVSLNFIIKKDKKINSYENEYIQIILNLLSNAKDALVIRHIKDAKINIILNVNKNHENIISISDNAKGIEEKIIEKIFDPYFTTKAKNSGIGLYMSKIIASSHLNAQIKVYNTDIGACFELKS